jgi:hypothetical protein
LPHSQTPAAHVPVEPVVVIVQVDPAATQRLEEQQAPAALQGVVPAQQGFPVTPHGRQTPAVVSHTFVGSLHWLPGQQGSPAPPQWRH